MIGVELVCVCDVQPNLGGPAGNTLRFRVPSMQGCCNMIAVKFSLRVLKPNLLALVGKPSIQGCPPCKGAAAALQLAVVALSVRGCCSTVSKRLL